MVMKRWLLYMLVGFYVFYNEISESDSDSSKSNSDSRESNSDSRESNSDTEICLDSYPSLDTCSDAICRVMMAFDGILENGDYSTTIEELEKCEQLLENIDVGDRPIYLSAGRLVAFMSKPKGPFRGLNISASRTRVTTDGEVANSTVRVQLPRELLQNNRYNTLVFCMITCSERNGTIWEKPYFLGGRLIGLSVSKKRVSGLKERVNISMSLQHHHFDEGKQPSCVYLNFSTKEFHDDGCLTLWKPGQSHVTCSCDHLTFFAVLMVSPQISSLDQENLSYITLIGCSLSLFFLVIAVVLFFITRRRNSSDVSMKIHVNLAMALILLNLHFLPSRQVAALPYSGLCVYMAVLLHYSLLATFSWTALEGFHLYRLLVRVFNIYIRRYLLKLSLVGWGIPAVIVIVVVIIDRDTYGRVALSSSDTNSTAMEMCYVSSKVVKMTTTVGVFSLVFVFNLAMLALTARHVLGHKGTGQEEGDRAKRDACTLLGITCLLGITWGLVFFSFGHLTTPAIYLFCIFNSLQGFFIFLWLFAYKWKFGTTSSHTGTKTHSTQHLNLSNT